MTFMDNNTEQRDTQVPEADKLQIFVAHLMELEARVDALEDNQTIPTEPQQP